MKHKEKILLATILLFLYSLLFISTTYRASFSELFANAGDYVIGFAYQAAVPEETEKCEEGEKEICGSNIGACVAGLKVCENGIWSDCIGDIGPVVETLNGIDDDCDGLIDEDFSTESEKETTIQPPEERTEEVKTQEKTKPEAQISMEPQNTSYKVGDTVKLNTSYEKPMLDEIIVENEVYTVSEHVIPNTQENIGYVIEFYDKPLAVHKEDINRNLEEKQVELNKVQQEFEAINITGVNLIFNFFKKAAKSSRLAILKNEVNELKKPIEEQLDRYKKTITDEHDALKSVYTDKVIREHFFAFNGLVLNITEGQCNELKTLDFVKGCSKEYKINGSLFEYPLISEKDTVYVGAYTVGSGLSEKSVIKNTGALDINGYLLMKVQKLSGNKWNDEKIVWRDIHPRTIKAGTSLQLGTLWNHAPFTIDTPGTYRMYISMLNEKNSVIETESGLFETWHEFNVAAS